MPSKTPEGDFKRFESFIDGMEDIEYEYWYRNEATVKQRQLADGIRETLTDKQAEKEGIYP
jgi:hypothetical protein